MGGSLGFIGVSVGATAADAPVAAVGSHSRLTAPVLVAVLVSLAAAALSWAAESTPWFSIVGGFIGPTSNGAQDVTAFYYLDRVCASGIAGSPLLCAEFSSGQAGQAVSQSFSSRLVASAAFYTIAGLCALASASATLAHGMRGVIPVFIPPRVLRPGAVIAGALAVAFSVAGAALAMVTFSTSDKLAGFVPSRIDGIRNGGRWSPGLALGLSAAVLSLISVALVVAVTHEKSRTPSPAAAPLPRLTTAEFASYRKYGGHAANTTTQPHVVSQTLFSPIGRSKMTPLAEERSTRR